MLILFQKADNLENEPKFQCLRNIFVTKLFPIIKNFRQRCNENCLVLNYSFFKKQNVIDSRVWKINGTTSFVYSESIFLTGTVSFKFFQLDFYWLKTFTTPLWEEKFLRSSNFPKEPWRGRGFKI